METSINITPYRSLIARFLSLIVLSFLIFYFCVGDKSIWAGDIQGMRAEVVREMIESGDWWNLTLNGERYIAKPPLYYWLAGLFSQGLGEVNEFSTRLPSVFSAFLGLIATWYIGFRLFGERVGWRAVLILCTCPLYIILGRASNLDMTLSALTTGTIACFLEALQGARWKNVWFVLGSVLLGLAVLTKGPIGFLVPFFPIGYLVHNLTRKRSLDISLRTIVLGGTFFLLVSLPWFLWSGFTVPNSFRIFYQETFFRFEPKSLQEGKPFYSYFVHLITGIFPWTFFLPGVIGSLVARYREKRFEQNLILLVAWIVPLFILFSCTSTKRPWYLLPLLPSVSIMIAWFWETATRESTPLEKKLLHIGLWCITGVLSILGIGGIVVIAAGGFGVPLYPVLAFIIIIFFFFCAHFLSIKQRRYSRAFIILETAIVFSLTMWVKFWLPKVDEYRSRKSFFEEISSVVGSNPVVNYGYSGYDPQFYMRRNLMIIDNLNELQNFTADHKEFYLITESDKIKDEISCNANLVRKGEWVNSFKSNRSRKLFLFKCSEKVG